VILDKETINAKRDALSAIATTLKSEFFGLDTIIDQVMSSIEAWYICPEIITRPVIVNLWGMTGVGKTALVRRLSSLLGFSDRFVEVVMDGGSQHGYWSSTLASILRDSKIEEAHPGILLLDEMQRFRTVDTMGGDIEVERYADTWTLLSDGKFSANSSAIAEVEMMFAEQLYDVEEPETTDELINGKDEEKKEKKISPWQARSLKKTLRLSESIATIMSWKKEDIQEALRAMDDRESWEYDYTKLVIFVSGNLDQAFVGATATGDSDTDADFYHNLTKNVSLSQIKKSLTAQFRPEQVARFGSNHVIYPSMSKASYQALIKSTCKRYTDEMENLSGKSFVVADSLLAAIYENSVFPTQGTRPVFSAIHMIFSSLLMAVTFWMIEEGHESVKLEMVGEWVKPGEWVKATTGSTYKMFKVDMRLSEQRAQITDNFRTMVAVHEAGHALVYAIKHNCAPFEVKVNVASFTGGYMANAVPSPYKIENRASIRAQLEVMLAGRCAEEIVFGKDGASNGAESDIAVATTTASHYVRKWGFDNYTARVESGKADRITWITKIAETDESIIGLLEHAYDEASHTLRSNTAYFVTIVKALLEKGVLTQAEFIELSKPFRTLGTEEMIKSHTDAWDVFQIRNELTLNSM
jgi:hypothetical protein